ncbi:hypothetical protein CRG98_000027 [Punica granatum]|uniref:Uncharacterized protein n=1 Tax=Punica granatum TaxID=22663 RepID=A0A2I0LFU5_PUNGR|nr:hypothetical protein CRG98_000027 [Punica granatum]
MQLQRLNSPLSFYNNPALWPKMHPLHEKMINNLQLSSENLTSYVPDQVQMNPPSVPNPEHDQNFSSFYGPVIAANAITSLHQESLMKINDSDKTSPRPKDNGLVTEEMLYGNNMQPAVISSLIHSDHYQRDGLLGNYCKTSGANSFMSQENQQHHQMMLDFDYCFKGILDDSNSWDDSSSADVQAGPGVMNTEIINTRMSLGHDEIASNFVSWGRDKYPCGIKPTIPASPSKPLQSSSESSTS